MFLNTRKKINYRHLLLHFLAIYLLQQGFFHFCFLTDIELLEIYKSSGGSPTSISEKEYAIRSSHLYNNAKLLSTGGMIAGLIVSLVVSSKRKWYWQNTLIAFLFFVIINNIMSEDRLRLGQLLLWIGDFSDNFMLLHMGIAFFFIGIGLLLLLLNPIQRFIQNGQKVVLVESFQFEDQPTEI